MTRDFIAIRDRIENQIIGKIDRKHNPRPPTAVVVWLAPSACEFTTGDVTPEMERHAEAVSHYYYQKRVARAAERRAA